MFMDEVLGMNTKKQRSGMGKGNRVLKEWKALSFLALVVERVRLPLTV